MYQLFDSDGGSPLCIFVCLPLHAAVQPKAQLALLCAQVPCFLL